MKHRLAKGVTLIITLIIVFAALAPRGMSPLALLSYQDKILHVFAFAALVFPMTWVQPKKCLQYGCFALSFGVVIEIFQPYFGREFAIADLVANIVGALLGGVSAIVMKRWLWARAG